MQALLNNLKQKQNKNIGILNSMTGQKSIANDKDIDAETSETRRVY